MKYLIKNEKSMQNLAKELLATLTCDSDNQQYGTVLALNGELGAGKTTFTKAFAKELGITEYITSPTFVLQKSYTIPQLQGAQHTHMPYTTLVHIDAYRLNGADDMQALDWQNTRDNPDNVVLVEWAEIIFDVLPSDTIRINFTYIDESTREVDMDI
jgi:tRNA threonylcarbamoyladenosine biosynthesis protein TsaE